MLDFQKCSNILSTFTNAPAWEDKYMYVKTAKV